ncbi:hypothetical protein WJX72_002054 [[Myrmecia] bisecta]|uniref:Glycosyl transferase CAP10 domain-containing protein n=1 Tax=[Myrmecia] bisecta TaxID=41462 RepID=A0AAW1PVB6_9CHLO
MFLGRITVKDQQVFDGRKRRCLGLLAADGRAGNITSCAPEARRAHPLFRQVALDFAAFDQTGITLKMVEQAYCTHATRSFRLQVIDGNVYIVGETPPFLDWHRQVKLQILEVAMEWDLPDLDLVITSTDTVPANQSAILSDACPDQGPVLATSKRDADMHAVLYPDSSFGDWPDTFTPGWKHIRYLLEKSAAQHPWEQRQGKLFFRGASTGNRGILAENKSLIRSPMDIRILDWAARPAADHVSLVEHCRYKYLLHMPGNFFSARLRYLLMCNSTVIFPDPGWYEFWYQILEDDKHFIKVDAVDETNRGNHLRRVVEQLEGNQELAKAIARQGMELIQTTLTPEAVKSYWLMVFAKYASLQRFQPTLHPDVMSLGLSLTKPNPTIDYEARTCQVCPRTRGKDP